MQSTICTFLLGVKFYEVFMNMQEIYAAVEKIGCLSVTTEENRTLHSRIISIAGADDDGLYFLTMTVKPFYRQLKNNPNVALCGIYPHGRKDGKNAVGQPYLVPGYTIRISGKAYEVPIEELHKKASHGHEVCQYTIEERGRYPDMCLFCVTEGQGEIYDYDFEMENRDHKLQRTAFAFGGMEIINLGAKIDQELCIACGECFNTCTFKAIISGEPYTVNTSRCDMCGSCSLTCPQHAISY